MKVVKTETVNIATLLLEYDIYPRHSTSEVRINEYYTSLKAGAKFPPIIADIKTRWVVDGFHRYKMYLKAGVEKVEVEWREFEDKKELIWYAINLNSAHGLKLTTYDQSKCIIIGEGAGMTDDELTSALVITKIKFESIKANRIRQVEISPLTIPEGTKEIPKFESVAVKRIIADATEETVTDEQVSGQKSMGCMRASYYIKEARRILELGVLPVNDINIDIVRHLSTSCVNWLETNSVNKGA